MGVELTDLQLEQLLSFADLIEKWNKRFNLVSRQDIQRLGNRHLLDSLSGVSLVRGASVLDLGSGAGLPGVPLAIALPDTSFTLADRRGRRTRFLQQAVATLGLTNVEVWQGDYGQEHPPGVFDCVVARGVATVNEVWAMVRPQLAANGRVLVYESTGSPLDTSETAETETTMHREPLAQCELSRFQFHIPGIPQAHTIVCATAVQTPAVNQPPGAGDPS